MTQRTAAPVVAVGVNETNAALEAARYAAWVAHERSWDLLVVHGYPLPPTTAGMTAELLARSEADAGALVDRVVAGLKVGTHTRVRRLVTPAALVSTLRAVSGEVSLLVLGRHHFDLAHQLFSGRVSPAVVAGAHCPVVVVPPGWSGSSTAAGPVAVALDVETPAVEALHQAFEEAERRRAEVVALHAIPLYGEGSFFSEEQAALGELLAGAKQDHPDVRVRTLLMPGEPAVRIIEESVHAGLMVVGRPHRGRHLGSWSASVARAVMDRSFCPVLVAPPHERVDRDQALSGSGGRSHR